MKYAIIIPLILFLVLPVSFSQVNIPAPFSRAKEMVLKTDIDEACRHLVILELNRNGDSTTYMLGYFIRFKIIGIGRGQGRVLIAVEFDEVNDCFYLFKSRGGMATRENIKKEKAISLAFEIFREMVSEKLI